MRGRSALALTLAAVLPSCAETPPPAAPPSAAAAAAEAPRSYPEPVYTIPRSATDLEAAAAVAAAAAASPPQGPEPDTCGAGALAGLVGKPRTEIPVPADLGHRRVVCTTCPVTQDVDPTRQTITYDAATGRVTKVACG